MLIWIYGSFGSVCACGGHSFRVFTDDWCLEKPTVLIHETFNISSKIFFLRRGIKAGGMENGRAR